MLNSIAAIALSVTAVMPINSTTQELGDSASQVIGAALYEAVCVSSRAVEPEHIFVAILRGSNEQVARLLATNRIRPADLLAPFACANASEAASSEIPELPLSNRTKKLVNLARAEALAAGEREVTPAHLFLALFGESESESIAVRELNRRGLVQSRVRSELVRKNP
jgi:ATP-dependent Clp protease ATP-binding subunit ClpC